MHSRQFASANGQPDCLDSSVCQTRHFTAGAASWEKVVCDRSGIPSAGTGLFAGTDMAKGELIAYFGGTLICRACMRRQKLHVSRRRFSVMLIDAAGTGDSDDDTWYIMRSGNGHLDGALWFTNSCSLRNRKTEHQHHNVEFVSQGFGAGGVALVYATAVTDIQCGAELLSDYLMI